MEGQLAPPLDILRFKVGLRPPRAPRSPLAAPPGARQLLVGFPALAVEPLSERADVAGHGLQVSNRLLRRGGLREQACVAERGMEVCRQHGGSPG
jgi:hypothetical protein